MPIDTTNQKSRTLEEVSKEMRSAGAPKLEDERAEDKKDPRVGAESPSPADKVVVPPAATDDAVVVNPEEAFVEPPTPDKLTPQEMQQNPADLLNPPEPEAPASTPINPEAEATSNLQANEPEGKPAAEPEAKEEADEETVKAMGADPQVTQAMKEATEKKAEAERIRNED